ncbi:short-chain dehydrogenase TIC 32, chloroplastic-like [Phalaenopsis equestris]|uniref:short-chain dehydrogenase TIC 32, chloroplastic-like n=1 Tax=Phalaenopsis equestris TaxID=78828 RepID=UPI0009E1E770|nr:short-chain dehydrogenase TIC 32, chloroplastic-like [Phalaenopsis equestris]
MGIRLHVRASAGETKQISNHSARVRIIACGHRMHLHACSILIVDHGDLRKSKEFEGGEDVARKSPSGFSWYSTAEEVTRGLDGSGLTAIVTGASSGIGLETARVLALRGVQVIMAVRSLSSGNGVRETILKEIPSAKVDVLELDLASKESVRKFASEYNSLELPLNILINNAGVMATPFMLSQDGIELQFATNHVGHFLLTHLLLENMKKTARDSKIEGRIVNVSSEGHRFAYREGIRFDRINERSDYSTLGAYGQSKLANILHANELARRFKEDEVDITANSLHPGSIITNLLRHHSFIDFLSRTLGKLVLKNAQQGAATTCYAALHPDVKGVSGKYFNNSNIADPSAKAKDADLAKKLWDFSMELI